MSTLWPLILDQRVPYTKNWLHCLFSQTPLSQQWKFLETRQKGWQRQTGKQEKRDKKQETKWKGRKRTKKEKMDKRLADALLRRIKSKLATNPGSDHRSTHYGHFPRPIITIMKIWEKLALSFSSFLIGSNISNSESTNNVFKWQDVGRTVISVWWWCKARVWQILSWLPGVAPKLALSL